MMEALFGELRSLLHQPKSDTWGQELLALSQRAHEEDASHWHDVWKPYLSQNASLFPRPLLVATSIQELERYVSLLPGACFTLRLHYAALDDYGMKELMASPMWESIDGFDLFKC